MLNEQAHRNGRRQQLCERVSVVLLFSQPDSYVAQIAKAEGPAENRSLGQRGLRGFGKMRSAALDQRADGRRQEPLRIGRQRPEAVDLLNQTSVAVRMGL